ncbi:MAG TPA: 3-dehydroquinate synthase [Candidatus Treponema faecavium]|nr:3-dehydroquinate synthase [Candidatus Treponema faecavium]
MQYNSYTLRYNAPPAEQADIVFSRGNPDLSALFPADAVPAGGQLFVADTAVSRLPCCAPFFAQFTGAAAGVPSIGRRADASALLIIEAGEAYKTIETVLAILDAALAHGLTRSGVFIGIGGGVITDMTAFAASIFKRGAAVHLVPTTLLAMVDAAIGGKTGCDFGIYKNMTGTFFPARRIDIMSGFISTLPESEYRSGLAEAVKTALLFDPELYRLLDTEQDAVTRREQAVLETMIERSARAKAAVVAEDLSEKGRRIQLNLGHTFGHALESVLGLGAIPHGDAVAWGIARAAQLACNLGICTPQYAQTVTDMLARYGWCTGAVHTKLAGSPPEQTADAIISAMKKDKKNSSSRIRVVLQKELHDTLTMEVSDQDIRRVLLPESREY